MTDPNPSSHAHSLPETFGEYRVIGLLGEGGMGTVYEAEQQHPKRRVALKVIRAGFVSVNLLRRFEHEAEILARLQHVGIAQIHEARTLTMPNGVRQPYLAMELVRGQTVTEFASARLLDIRQRLELMVRICEAVEHAHQRGIVHRDLKPANILVDDTGQPKILDFGLARLTDSDVQATMHTDLGQLVGTLPYMSPEQAAGEPDEIDTRSDVYALGVISYELLAGKLPLDLHRRMLPEAVRMIREEPPSRLSSIDRNLRGDVETIVGKTLEKDKARRYQSAGELASDIQRYLRHEAITARPASTWYQMRMFARRNRVLVGGILATFAALAGGLVVSATQYVQAADARDLAETRRKEAVESAGEAQDINTFLLEMLGSASLVRLGRNAKVSEALDAASNKVAESFARRPRLELGVRDILAQTYISLGMFDEGEPHARRAIELSTKLGGPGRAWRAKGLRMLVRCLTTRGDHASGVGLLEEAVRLAEQCEGESTLVCSIRLDLAETLRLLDRYEESEALYRSVLAGLRQSGAESRELQVALNELAVLLQHRGFPQQAEPLYREAAEIAERLLGPDDPDTLTARFNVASAVNDQGDAEQAEAIMTEVVPRIRATFGDAHLTTAEATQMLGRLLVKRGRPREARPLLEEAVAVRVRVQGDRTLDVAKARFHLAKVPIGLEEYAVAIPLLRDVVSVWDEHGKSEDREAISASSDLALALARTGRADLAEPIYRRVIDIASRNFGAEDKATVIAQNSLGVLIWRAGRQEEAEPWFRQALDSLERAHPANDRDTVLTLQNLVRLRNDLGHVEEAAARVPELLERCASAFESRHPTTALVHTNAAVMLRDVGRLAESEQLCRKAQSIWREALGERHAMVGLSLRLLAELRLAQGDAEGALACLEEALPILEAGDATALVLGRSVLGECLGKLGRYSEAEPLLLESQPVIDAAKEQSRWNRRRATERLVEFYAAWNAAAPTEERARQLADWQARLAARNARR